MISDIPLIVITGTNASGKSSLGLQLAQKYNGEIISADSRQIFKGFDLCCGKVTTEERQLVPHHMLDICSVGESYSVSDYQAKVYELINDIHSRGKLPFIVGGTGLYVDAVVKGYDFKSEEINTSFRNELEQKSVSELQEMLSSNAFEYLVTNHSDFNNKRRLVRVIEKERNGSSLTANNKPFERVLQIGVTWPKEMLHQRIEERLALRIEQGMLDEVKDYLDQGGNPEYLYSLGLEYKYIAWYHEGKYDSINDFSLEMAQAIKRFAKQQMKWFKRNSDIQWIDMTKDPFAESSKLIDCFIN